MENSKKMGASFLGQLCWKASSLSFFSGFQFCISLFVFVSEALLFQACVQLLCCSEKLMNSEVRVAVEETPRNPALFGHA